MVWVRKCMWVVLTQQKNGLPASFWRLMKSLAAATKSSSQVSMRFLVSGPVSSIFCLPTLPQRGCSVGSSLSVAQAAQDAARPESLVEFGEVLLRRPVGQLRFLFGIEVVEVAEELIEAMHGRQELIAIAEMVLAELAGCVAERLQEFGDGRVFRAQTHRRPGKADLGQSGAKTALPRDERSAAGGAALLAVGIGEEHPFGGDAIDVGRAIAHQSIGCSN